MLPKGSFNFSRRGRFGRGNNVRREYLFGGFLRGLFPGPDAVHDLVHFFESRAHLIHQLRRDTRIKIVHCQHLFERQLQAGIGGGVVFHEKVVGGFDIPFGDVSDLVMVLIDDQAGEQKHRVDHDHQHQQQPLDVLLHGVRETHAPADRLTGGGFFFAVAIH